MGFRWYDTPFPTWGMPVDLWEECGGEVFSLGHLVCGRLQVHGRLWFHVRGCSKGDEKSRDQVRCQPVQEVADHRAQSRSAYPCLLLPALEEVPRQALYCRPIVGLSRGWSVGLPAYMFCGCVWPTGREDTSLGGSFATSKILFQQADPFWGPSFLFLGPSKEFAIYIYTYIHR